MGGGEKSKGLWQKVWVAGGGRKGATAQLDLQSMRLKRPGWALAVETGGIPREAELQDADFTDQLEEQPGVWGRQPAMLWSLRGLGDGSARQRSGLGRTLNLRDPWQLGREDTKTCRSLGEQL